MDFTKDGERQRSFDKSFGHREVWQRGVLEVFSKTWSDAKEKRWWRRVFKRQLDRWGFQSKTESIYT